MSTFGERLRELRKDKGLSQRDLASQTCIDFTYISKLELNIPGYSPSPWLISQLALALDVSEDELLNLAGKIPPGLKKMMEDNPLLTELVRVLSERVLPYDTYRKMIELAREAGI
jgi:transcriptional regulator with XRE-family HTH domain